MKRWHFHALKDQKYKSVNILDMQVVTEMRFKHVYLNLSKGDFKAEAFVEVGVQCVLLNCRLLLLETLSIVLQNHFHKRI